VAASVMAYDARLLHVLTDADLVRLWLAGDGVDETLAAEMACREIDF